MSRLVVLCLLLVGCQGAEECKGWAGGGGFSSWSSCGDKKQRKVDCDQTVIATAATPTKCTCSVDGVIGKSFQTTDPAKLGTLDTATSIANEQCGWHLSR